MRPCPDRRTVAVLILLSAPLFFGGCAGIMTERFPATDGRLSIGVTDKEPALHDLAEGAHQIPHTNLYVADVQGDEEMAAPSVVLGLLTRPRCGY